jgi:RraA family protein
LNVAPTGSIGVMGPGHQRISYFLKVNDMTEKSSTADVVRREIERVPADVVARAAEFQAAILADVNGRRGALNGKIAALDPSMKIAGPAITVEVRPGDNLMIHAAMAIAQPGDVLVIDGKGDLNSALMGAIMMNQAKAIGLAGVVIDGAVRDVLEIREMGFPVFAAGTNPNGPTKLVPGRVNWPISAGGHPVNPGDLVVADADGVVVIEREKAASLLGPAEKKVADETKRIQGILRNEQLRPAWLDGALRAASVLKEGETL